MDRIYYSLKLRYSNELKREADRLDQNAIKTYHAVKAYYLDKLHVLFSRRKAAEWLGYVFFIMAIVFFFNGSPPTWIYITAGLAAVAFIHRFYYAQQYIKWSRYMNMGMSLLEDVVFNKSNKMQDF